MAKKAKYRQKSTSDAVEILHRRYHNTLWRKLLYQWHKILFRIEDWRDLRAARKAIKRNDFISWEKLKKELDL